MISCGEYGEPVHVRNVFDHVIRACKSHMRCTVCGIAINPQKHLAVWFQHRVAFAHTWCEAEPSAINVRRRQQLAFPATVRTLIDAWIRHLTTEENLDRKSFYDEVLKAFLENTVVPVFPTPIAEWSKKNRKARPSRTFRGESSSDVSGESSNEWRESASD